MMRTTLTNLVIAGAIGGGLGLQPAVQAAETDTMMRRQLDCWIGAKFGDGPGQLIRGWVCEPRFHPVPEAKQTSAAPELRFPDKQDVAAISARSHPH